MQHARPARPGVHRCSDVVGATTAGPGGGRPGADQHRPGLAPQRPGGLPRAHPYPCRSGGSLMARPDPPPRLGTLEAQVMDRVWDRPGVTVRDVIEDLSGRPAYTTIDTVLTIPVRKQLVPPIRSVR